MSRRCIFLTGAPLAEHLDWSESSLVTEIQPWPNISFTDDNEVSQQALKSKWRAVPFGPASATSTQVDDRSFGGAGSQPFDITEASILFHEDDTAAERQPVRFDSFSESFLSSGEGELFLTSRDRASDEQDESASESIIDAKYTDLKALPNAAALQRLSPQTVTVDLFAAVITVCPTKTVQLRRTNKQMEIIEVVLGDETRAGFSISVWLVPQDSSNAVVDDLRSVILSLRPGQVILVRNLALSVFLGTVHGQTLSKKYNRNTTTITKISKRARLSASNAHKVKKVREWAERFVPSRTAPQLHDLRSRKRPLPPDSQ